MKGNRNGFNAASYKRKTYTGKRKNDKNNPHTVAASLPDMESIDIESCWRAYQLNEPSCSTLHIPPNPKTQTCKRNPYCIHRLGLEKFEKLTKQREEYTPQNITIRSVDEHPCGLLNAGNFCYVNSFLQIWFNDLEFRQCIYDWQPIDDFSKPDEARFDVQAVMNCLQRLFLTMQFTPYEHTSANEFIQLLQLNDEQHDVQEFHTLFFDVLDRNLLKHPNGKLLRNSICSRFESRITQTISCSCGHLNETEGEYRSLQISIEGFTKLTDAIKAFFKPEPLTDFKCEQCCERGNVTRHSRFAKLPKVLIIQLNRYVFDAKGRYKKLKTAIQYPRLISPSTLEPGSDDQNLYELSAVMVHEGQNAHCGHYYDLIRSPFTSDWFTYNDKIVSKSKQPGVDIEKDNIGRATADMQGCYALIYKRKNVQSLRNALKLPNNHKAVQAELLEKFERETKHGSHSIKFWDKCINDRYNYFKVLWSELEVPDRRNNWQNPQSISFLPTKLLSDLLLNAFKSVEEMQDLTESIKYCSIADGSYANDGSDGDALARNSIEPKENLVNGFHETSELHNHSNSTQKSDTSDTNFKPLLCQKPQNENLEHLYVQEPVGESIVPLCPHGFFVPLSAVYNGELKAVNSIAANKLIDECNVHLKFVHSESKQIPTGVNGMLTGENLCKECVKLLKKESNFKEALEKTLITQKLILNSKNRVYNPPIGKFMQPPAKAYWISLNHLRSLKKLALEQMEKDAELIPTKRLKLFREQSSSHGNGNNGTHKENDDSICELTDEKENAKEDDDCKPFIDEPEPSSEGTGVNLTLFNEDLHCSHGGLANSVKRIWVTHEEWDIISRILTGYADPFPVNAQECIECLNQKNVQDGIIESSRAAFTTLKENLDKVLKLLEKRRFPLKNVLESDADESNLEFTHVICSALIDQFKQSSRFKNGIKTVKIPSICQDCLLCSHKRPYLELKGSEETKDSPFAIPLTINEWDHILEAFNAFLPNEPSPIEIRLGNDGTYESFCIDCYNEHKNNEEIKIFKYTDGAIYIKRMKSDEESTQMPSTSNQKYPTRRVAANRDLTKISICSKDTVAELKLKIYSKMHCSPNDQLLYFNGELLEDHLTLEEARIPPNNANQPIILAVQEHDSSSEKDSNKSRPLEKGFKDTALYG